MSLIFAVFKFAVAVFAVILILVGAIITPTPIPFGVVFMAIGFLLLAAVAPAFVRWLRRRMRWFDRLIHWLEKRLPEWIARPLRESDFEHQQRLKG